MNIAFISYWSCPLTKLGILDSGGMSVYLINFANELANLGNKVDIYTRTHKRIDEDEIVRHELVKIIHLPQKNKDLYQDIYNFSDEIIKYAKSNNINYDIIHSHYYYSGLVAIELQKTYHVSHVFTFHSLGKFEKSYDRKNTDKRIEAERLIVKNSDQIVVSTLAELNSIVANYKGDKNKIRIITPGVDHHIFKEMPKDITRKMIGVPVDLKLILYIGRIDPNKGINILLQAVSDLTKKYSEFSQKYRVILIGGDIKSNIFWKNREVIKIRTLIEEKDLACCVKFIGSKFHSELPKYYSAADLFILPSFHESFGLVVLEAMASGVVVIASRVGGLSYLVKDKVNGRLFERGNSKELGRIIWELLNDQKQMAYLSKNAISTSQKYCWNIQAGKILKIYNKLKEKFQ